MYLNNGLCKDEDLTKSNSFKRRKLSAIEERKAKSIKKHFHQNNNIIDFMADFTQILGNLGLTLGMIILIKSYAKK